MDKKRLQCSKCGCDELQFINVPHSVKGEAGIITFFQLTSWIFFFFSLAGFFSFLSLLDKAQNDRLDFLFIFSALFLIFVFISLSNAVILTIIRYFVPYKNKNVTEYVCCVCGNNEPLSNLTGIESTFK